MVTLFFRSIMLLFRGWKVGIGAIFFSNNYIKRGNCTFVKGISLFKSVQNNQVSNDDHSPSKQEVTQEEVKQKKSFSKREFFVRLFIWILVSPLLLLFMVIGALYIPPIQDAIVSLVEKKVNEKGDIKLSLGTLRLGFPLSLRLQNATAVRAGGDTLLRADNLSIRVSLIPLLSGIVESNRLSADNFSFHFSNELNTSQTSFSARTLEVGPLSANLSNETLDIGTLAIEEGGFSLFNADTLPKETSKPFTWHLNINKVLGNDFSVILEMPYDSLLVTAPMKHLEIEKLAVAVDSLDIRAEQMLVKATDLRYARDTIVPENGKIDFSRIYASKLLFDAKDFKLRQDHIAFEVKKMACMEHSGAVIQDLKGGFTLDNKVITVSNLAFLTPYSELRGAIRLPLTIFQGNDIDSVRAVLKGTIALADVSYFSGVDLFSKVHRNKAFVSTLTKEPFDIHIDLEGTMPQLEVYHLDVEKRNILSLGLKGKVNNPLNIAKLGASLDLRSRFYPKLLPIVALFSPALRETIAIPRATGLNGRVQLDGGRYSGSLQLSAPSSGYLSLKGNFYDKGQRYKLHIASKNFSVQDFLPKTPIGATSLNLLAEGRGFNFFTSSTKHKIFLNVSDLTYQNNLYEGGVSLEGTFEKGSLHLAFDSQISDALLSLQLEGEIKKELLRGKIKTDIGHLDFHHLGFTKDSTLVALSLVGGFESDLRKRHSVSLRVDTISYKTPSIAFDYDKGLSLEASTSLEQLSLGLRTGDLVLKSSIKENLDSLPNCLTRVNKTIANLLTDSIEEAKLSSLLALLPKTSIDLEMARRNLLSDILQKQSIAIGKSSFHLETFPEEKNLSLSLLAQNFQRDTLLIDTISLQLSRAYSSRSKYNLDNLSAIASNFLWRGTQPYLHHPSNDIEEDLLLHLNARVAKSAHRGGEPFDVRIKAETDLDAIDLDLLYEKDGRPLHKVGALAFRNRLGYGLSLKFQPIYLMGKTFLPNRDNALFYYDKQKKIKASLFLTTEQKGEIELKSIDEEGENGNKLNLLIRNFQLSLLNGLGGIDRLAGNTFADIILEEDVATRMPRVVGDLSINNLLYDNNDLGNISTALFYEPVDSTSHYINAQISHDGNLAFLLEGKYNTTDKESPIDANVKIQGFALPLLNPFIGKETATLTGFLDGDINVKGKPDKLKLRGSVTPDALFVYLPAVGEIFAVEAKPIRFEENKLFIDQIALRPIKQEKALTLSGSFNLFAPEAMVANLKIKGDEITLLDSKPRKGQLLYGKIVVSPNISVKGKVTAPMITGRLDLLGGTNATYVYTQNKLRAKNNMAGVVVFTDFADSLFVQKKNPSLQLSTGANIALNLHIDPAVRLGVDLDANHQDYVSIQGGGDLRLNIPPFSQMNLIGNFDFSGGGEVRYEIPVVGRKNFNIDPKSSISWTGDVLNPSVNFKATNRVRADVVENGQSRKVDFDVLIFAKETEEGYDVAFGLEAPNDFSIQNQLTTMSEEERGKQAIALMVSGSFLAGEATQASMQKILSNLAISELNNLTGKFLQGTDFNIGMDLHDGSENGSVYTDYSYSFSRRFFNDRIRVVFGGRVAAGNLPANYEQTFIDNVTLEYRLDKAGNKYVTLFHKRNNDNLFEGLVSETGVSYLFRRKLFSLGDLFKKGSRYKWQNKLDSDTTALGDSINPSIIAPIERGNGKLEETKYPKEKSL